MPSVPATAPTAQLSTSIFIPPQIQDSWAEHMQSGAATNTAPQHRNLLASRHPHSRREGQCGLIDQRVEQTNPQEQLEREQDQVRYRISLDAIRGQFQGTGSPTPPSTQRFDTGTVEELTASQFRTVYDYIVSNNILRDLVKYLKVPHRETTLVLHHRVTPHDEEDAEYTHLMQTNMPETLDPSSYIETLRWWRENYSYALMIHARLPQDTRGSPTPFGSAKSARSAQLPVVNPQFVRPQQTPTTRTDGRSEARQEHRGQRRTRPTSPDQRSQEVCPAKKSHEDTQRRTPRQRQQDSTTRTQHRRPAPTTQEDRPGPSRRRSPTPTPAPEDVWPTPNTYQWEESPAAQIYPPLPQPPKGVAFVFCNHLDHFSGDCPKHTSLTDRVEILKDHMLCCNCLRQHRGECVRRDPCSRCNREGHHRAVCIDNPTVVIDVRGTKDHIYEQMADYTYRPYPRNVTPPQKHPLPRKLADRARQETERTRRSHRPPTPTQHQEPSTSGYAYRPAEVEAVEARVAEQADGRERSRATGVAPSQWRWRCEGSIWSGCASMGVMVWRLWSRSMAARRGAVELVRPRDGTLPLQP
ncbi:unnamed protein product [Heligmosomoides polygyrus]|uniref:CCHC-type domain-containing protein n=1 Tax=Heligmosomoides polygyrus TaxID=6339 RepID=A0A183GRC3_HELPZ|nr:unnamed protein product [Heligmosomoides polygyrus]